MPPGARTIREKGGARHACSFSFVLRVERQSRPETEDSTLRGTVARSSNGLTHRGIHRNVIQHLNREVAPVGENVVDTLRRDGGKVKRVRIRAGLGLSSEPDAVPQPDSDASTVSRLNKEVIEGRPRVDRTAMPEAHELERSGHEPREEIGSDRRLIVEERIMERLPLSI